jgi:hypothetical protein
MVNLPNRRIYLKLMVDGVTSRPFSAATLPPIKTQFEAATEEEVIRASRKRYARPRYAVEEEINVWSEVMRDSAGQPRPKQAVRPAPMLQEKIISRAESISLKELQGKESFPPKEERTKAEVDIESARRMISEALAAPKEKTEENEG